MRKRLLPWLLFAALLFWGWRLGSLFKQVATYGDLLEVTWGISWYGETIQTQGADLSFHSPLIFHPEGWQTATLAHGPGLFLFLLPLHAIGGVAFAVNAGSLLALLLAFCGMYRLGRQVAPPFGATLAAFLFTFWGFHWTRLGGQLNLLLGTALLPWLAWSLDRFLRESRRRWLLLAGVLWGASISFSLYFLWLGGVLLVVWLGAGLMWRRERAAWRRAVVGILTPAGVALLLSSPFLYLFWQGRQAAGATLFNVAEIGKWGVSANALPLPFIGHPWLGAVTQAAYAGPVDEAGIANLGLLATLVLLFTLPAAWREKRMRPLPVVLTVGVVLALGPVLKWNDEPVTVQALRPVNAAIWRAGHALKPDLFGVVPPESLATAIPLPQMALAALIPFWEGARVVARFAFVAGVGFFPLVAWGVGRVRQRPLQLALAALLLLEIVPPPFAGVPFPPPEHPAFAWLRENTRPGTGIVDLYAPEPDKLVLFIRPETLWATRLHQRPTVSGASSVIPAHTDWLHDWLWRHPHPLINPDLVPLLRFYEADVLLVHMTNANAEGLLEEAAGNPQLGERRCFPPPAGGQVWAYPICVLDVRPAPAPRFDLVLREGWSRPEPWGVWAEGETSTAQWVAPAPRAQRLTLELFPHCVGGRQQTVAVWVNGERLAEHGWADCEPWQGVVEVPAGVVRVGWNDLRLEYGYALRPVDVTAGENPDPRPLAVGLSTATLEQAAD